MPKGRLKFSHLNGCDWNRWGLIFEDVAGRRPALTLQFVFLFLVSYLYWFFLFPIIFSNMKSKCTPNFSLFH